MVLGSKELFRLEQMSIQENKLRGQGFVSIAGIDEAGRGPLAGPVIAAACILPAGFLLEFLNDSKQVSVQKRDDLYSKLYEAQDVLIGVGQVDQEEIDRINILQATFLAMQKAVLALPKSPDFLLIDGNQLPSFSIPALPLVKGDSLSLSIAAASVIAKVTRDRWMEQLDQKWPQYGFAKHKGYGTLEHRQAIQKYGPCPEHRRTFLRKMFLKPVDSGSA